jgi:hypothetical protein
MLEKIIKAFDIWNKVDGIASIGEMALNQGALEAADMQMESAAVRYARNRDDKSVLADVKRIEQFLENKVISHTSAKDFINTDFGASKLVSARQSLWARELLLKLRFMQAMDTLPTTSKTPWSDRKRSLLRQRQGYVAMAIQFEGTVRHLTKDLDATREFQGKLMSIAMGADVTEADLQVLEEDYNEQEAFASSTKMMINRFALLANAANKTVKNIDRVIEAGDKKHGTKTAGR